MAKMHILSLLVVTVLSLATSTAGRALKPRMSGCFNFHSNCDNCCGNFCCSPGDDCVGGRCRAPPPPPPQAVKEMGLHMQYQQSSEWCWIAVATSINHFYNSGSSWTQCAVMTDVGHRLNGFPTDTSACPSADTLNRNPDLANELANPYSTNDLYILDNTSYGVPIEYLKSGNVRDPLMTTGNWGSFQSADITLTQVSAEINAGRPVAVDITWPSGLQHVVAIGGTSSDSVLILDPVYGQSVMLWNNFPSTYHGGATVNSYVFTQG